MILTISQFLTILTVFNNFRQSSKCLIFLDNFWQSWLKWHRQSQWPEFMTIFVTWQLRVTLDSIRNSCDVYTKTGSLFSLSKWLYMNGEKDASHGCLWKRKRGFIPLMQGWLGGWVAQAKRLQGVLCQDGRRWQRVGGAGCKTQNKRWIFLNLRWEEMTVGGRI